MVNKDTRICVLFNFYFWVFFLLFVLKEIRKKIVFKKYFLSILGGQVTWKYMGHIWLREPIKTK